MTTSPPVELVARIDLRESDMDHLGHLNQARYHAFLGTVRRRLMHVGAPEGAERVFVTARTELDYLREVRLADGHVDVRVRIARVGGRSVTIEDEIRRPDGDVAARGTSTMVAFDRETRRSRDLTADERRCYGAG